MDQASFFVLILLVAFILLIYPKKKALAYEAESKKPTIVLAAFGTTVPEALGDLENIVRKVTEAFPDCDIRLSFTSNIIRSVWRKRAQSQPCELNIKYASVLNPLSVLADIQETGAGAVLIQSLHITDGEEYQNLAVLVKALADQQTLQRSLRPFPYLKLGPPALGLGDGHPKYLDRAAVALADLLREAKERSDALVLMGHGNERLSQEVFFKFLGKLREHYQRVFLGTVEAEPLGPKIAQEVANNPPPSGRVIMAPLMVVAGDHARNDMAGPDPDSWRSLLIEKGFEVEARLSGLGSLDAWADIYVESLRVLYQQMKSDYEFAG
jgi:sirohydrochlorin cobaltochelatase